MKWDWLFLLILDHSSFFKCKIKNTFFTHSSIKDVDFSEADLLGSTFNHSDLTEAIFDQTNLENVDFTSSFNYTLDLDNNKVKGSKHSIHQVSTLLGKYKLIIE
jgi:fluoroquinolone resistance protein